MRRRSPSQWRPGHHSRMFGRVAHSHRIIRHQAGHCKKEWSLCLLLMLVLTLAPNARKHFLRLRTGIELHASSKPAIAAFTAANGIRPAEPWTKQRGMLPCKLMAVAVSGRKKTRKPERQPANVRLTTSGRRARARARARKSPRVLPRGPCHCHRRLRQRRKNSRRRRKKRRNRHSHVATQVRPPPGHVPARRALRPSWPRSCRLRQGIHQAALFSSQGRKWMPSASLQTLLGDGALPRPVRHRRLELLRKELRQWLQFRREPRGAPGHKSRPPSRRPRSQRNLLQDPVTEAGAPEQRLQARLPSRLSPSSQLLSEAGSVWFLPQNHNVGFQNPRALPGVPPRNRRLPPQNLQRRCHLGKRSPADGENAVDRFPSRSLRKERSSRRWVSLAHTSAGERAR